jgi:DNA-binding GntR family transcriptional regulator
MPPERKSAIIGLMKAIQTQEKLGSRHSPLTKLVTDAVRERILAGEFPPGERLAEERLSAELGVSRMPVREALRMLAAEGVVTIEPRRGASVTVYTEAQVQELIEVRATLEGLNARLAAKRHDPKQIAELERILADASKMNEKTDLAQIQAANERFHKAVEQIAANSVLMNIVRSLRDRTALIFAKQSRARVRQNWDEHAGIVRAVISGDAELAGLLASRHVYNAAQMPQPDAAARATPQEQRKARAA